MYVPAVNSVSGHPFSMNFISVPECFLHNHIDNVSFLHLQLVR